MLAILMFFFYILLFAAMVGVAAGIIFVVINFVYCLPYYWWLLDQNAMGRYKDKKDVSAIRHMRNATIVYKSWISKKEPNF